MRIDLNPSTMPELERSSGSAGATKAAQPGANSITGQSDDVAHLSTGSDAVAKLKAQLNAVPEVRQQRLEALRQVMSDGTFEVSPSRIASAMLADRTRG